jgi:uncharacterized integral membrane protein (TIGR00698 family)
MKSINRIIFITIIATLLGLNYIEFAYKAFLPGAALVLGIVLTSLWHEPSFGHRAHVWSTKTLSYAIILLGFGFNLSNILKAGIAGLGYTVISIAGTLIIGLIIGRYLKNDGKISTLISCGTAICGGSAIAAISPILKSKPEQTAIAMGVVFLLNAVGLLVFPFIGHELNLTQQQFGLLAALAIHDTSSVVGSCISYGPTALIVGTTVKLVRALWIVPVALIIALVYSRISNHHEGHSKTKKPWFILWFVLASLTVTIFPNLAGIGLKLKHVGESLFIVALFLIGYNVSWANMKAVGLKVFTQAVSLWLIVSFLAILALKFGLLN